jgi:hypothetical protein
MANITIVDVTGADTFSRIPPCADPRFDHRTCDYWEDADRGSKANRPSWLEVSAPAPAPRSPLADNPFAPTSGPAFENPFALAGRADLPGSFVDDDLFATPLDNPFAPGGPRQEARQRGLR